MRARARIVAEAVSGGGTRLSELVAAAPFALRETADGLFLVSSAQGLLGDDALELDIFVGRGARLSLRSAAAAIAYASMSTRFDIRVEVGSGGILDWRPEPLIATSRCHLDVFASVNLEAGAGLDWTDECLLGRAGEEPGALNLSLAIDHDRRAALRHQLVIGAASPGWNGPAVLGGHRAIGLGVLIDGCPVAAAPPPRSGESWAMLPLDSGGTLITALGADLLEMRNALQAARTSRLAEGALSA